MSVISNALLILVIEVLSLPLLLLLLLLLLVINFGNSSTGEISRHRSCQNGSILFINMHKYTTCF